MLSKSNVKSFVVGSACTAVLATSVAGFASGGITKTIEAFYNNVKLVVDGRPVSLGNDLAGNKIEPFIYKGTTYLPVRAVGEALDKKVDWDGNTQTVYIGESAHASGESKYITEVLDVVNGRKTYTPEDYEKFKMGGKEYNIGHEGKNSCDFMYFNLDSKYTQVEGEIGAISPDTSSLDLNILLDEKVYKTITIAGDKSPQKITIPVSGVNQLKFQLAPGEKTTYYWESFGLGDFTIK